MFVARLSRIKYRIDYWTRAQHFQYFFFCFMSNREKKKANFVWYVWKNPENTPACSAWSRTEASSASFFFYYDSFALVNISNLRHEETHKTMNFQKERQKRREKEKKRNGQCLLNVKPAIETSNAVDSKRMQWTQLLLTVALSTAILYSIRSLSFSAKWTYFELLKLPFSKPRFRFIVTHIRSLSLSICLSFTVRFFLPFSLLVCFAWLRVFFRSPYIGLCLLFNLHTCIRYDWFVMCIWFVFPFVVSPCSLFFLCMFCACLSLF